jgi:salicylate hydroxylase
LRWSIAIAGAGPAGLAAALLLARAGHRVTVFERFDEPRPIGSGLMLQPTGMAVLAELGLAAQVRGLGQRIERLFGRVCPSNRIILDVRYDRLGRDYSGLAVHRAALFAPLHQAVRTDGIAIETGVTITGAEPARARLITAGGRTIDGFDLVIDAMGVRSPLAPLYGAGSRVDLPYGALWATLPWPRDGFDINSLEQRYRRADVMVGVLPIGRPVTGEGPQTAFFWSLKPADYERWRSDGLAPWKERVRALWPQTAPLLDGIHDPEQMTFARYAHHTLRRPAAGRIVAIGDSAHAASPQLGQGANMALLDARALALALERSRDLDGALARYLALRRWHVRLYQALSAGFTPFYQSDSRVLPPLRDWIVAPATRLSDW